MSKIYKSVFTAQVHSVSLALKFSCFVSVTWRRGDKIAQVKEKKGIEKGVATFNEPLELECNMSFDTNTKKFQQKKTRFTVLIFSEKGNKQAGEVTFDVAEFLNAKQKQVKLEKTLDKCPDKNAKISFTLSAYIKEEVQADAVSMRSEGSSANNMSMLSQSTVQPDFKKKKVDEVGPMSPKVDMSKRAQSSQKASTQQRIPMVNKVSKEKLKLQQENRKLKAQLQELRQLQLENSTLKRRYEQAEKKALSYYSKKMEEMKKQFKECKMKAKGVQALQAQKQALQSEMCQCKQQMGRILNFAMTSKNNSMAQQIYTIYQTCKP